MKELIQHYTQKIAQACLIPTPTTRARRINDILFDMRKDKAVPHLTLCAFLQDNARLIKEELK